MEMPMANRTLSEDVETLLEIKDTLAGEGTLNWRQQFALHSWEGVVVTGSRVTELHLKRKNLSGKIPPALSRLGSLRKLDLSNNNLSGEIPPQFGNFRFMCDLDLQYNNLVGDIPSDLGELSELRRLFLRRNQLSGKIPPSLGKLQKLERLSLRYNRLTGEIPATLGDLNRLRMLSLGGNQLTGKVPDELGKLANLKDLSLRNNRLTGTIPTSLSKLPGLQRISLRGNQFEGNVPANVSELRNMPASSVNAIERPKALTESHFVLGAAFGQGGLTFEQESQKWEASDDEATEYYVYILKLSGGDFYVGQTRELPERMAEHRDGKVRSTAAKTPKLVWFTTVPKRDDALKTESQLKKLYKQNPRKILRMVRHFKTLAEELDFD